MPPLRWYQLEPARAIARSVVDGLGLTFSVMMSRQAGKNELSGQLELQLLSLYLNDGREGVKAAPTMHPQARISQARLLRKAREAGLGRLVRVEDGYKVRLGSSTMAFLSAEPEANVVGHTANLILEVDEAQDVDPDKFDKDFRPMGASTGVTTVFYGTPWADDSLLEQAKQRNLDLQRKDGIRRHFEYDWTLVGRDNPVYRGYVEEEIARLGASHPLILTQYAMKTLAGLGRMFGPTDRALLQGLHVREDGPVAGVTYVASVDVGGTGELGSVGGHDATVLSVGKVQERAGVGPEERLTLELVRQYQWVGVPIAERDAALAVLLERWDVTRVVVDATGLGESVAVYLIARLGESRVEPFKFTGPSKSEVGYGLLAWVRSGRCRVHAGDGSPELAELWRQLVLAKAEFLPDELMRFYVDEDEGHDDHLVGLALLVRAAESGRPRVARGRFDVS